LAGLFIPSGNIDDFEGKVFQFSADGQNYWPITPNGGAFDGPPTIYGSSG
jgi:hypothetical protein